MDNAAAFRDRFREARKKRAQDRGIPVTKVGSLCAAARVDSAVASQGDAKRHRQTVSTDAPSQPDRAPVQETASEGALTKEERDRILMPPPPPLQKQPEPGAPTAPVPTAPTDDNSPAADGEESGLPEGFFEVEAKAAKEQLERSRLEEKTDAEYIRFMSELEDSFVAMSEQEILEEEQSQQHRQESESFEQEQRLKAIREMKSKRQQRPIPVRTAPTAPMEIDPESDEDETDELQWRQKGL